MAENILHFGGVRLRVNGTGVLRMRLIGLDDVASQTLYPLTMSLTPGREPRVLANFKSQRARLEFTTTDINEFMRIDKVVIFVKELWTDFPG